MKNLVLRSLTLSGLLCASLAFSQEWTEPITIGNGYTPDFDIDPVSGKLFIVHHNNGLIYTEMDAKGNFLVQEPIDAANGDAIGRGQFGATIAFDPKTGRAHVCYRINVDAAKDLYDIFYIRRKADGTWTAPLRIVQGKERAYSVRFDVDNNGVAHVVHGEADGVEPFGVATYIRITNGVVDQTINDLRKYRVDDRVELSVGQDNSIHVILSSPDDLVGGSAVTYYASTDGGATLPKYADVHDIGTAKGRNGNADVVVDKSGNVHFAYGSAGFPNVDGPRTLHYSRYVGENRIRDVIVTEEEELQPWHHGGGIGSVGVSDDGKLVVMAYQVTDGGQLRSRLSKDGGATWSDFTPLASQCGGEEGRDKQIVRGRNNTFYLVYPSSKAVHLRILKAANDAPVANAGGPYTGKEGAAINFDASKSTGDVPILLYRWDWTNDGVYDDSSASAKMSHTYPDNFAGSAKLQVKGQDGLRGTALAQVTVTNVAPVAQAGGPYGGGVNKAIALTGSATDVGVADVLTYAWDLDNNGTFEKPGQNVNVTFTTTGAKKVKLQVKDDDGGASVDSATVNVGSNAPSVTKIPDQTIQEGQTFAQIQLDNFVTDLDHTDNQIVWTASGQVKLIVTIINRIAKVALPDSEFAGTEQITFTAKDPENNTGASTAIFKVNGVNDAPRVTIIAAQRVNEGKSFEKITLDNFVFDPDHADNQIIWSANGQVNLTVNLLNRIATIAPADSEWAGTERIDFTAKDPAGAQATIAQVRFTIDPVNDAPRISVVPEQIINRGGTFPVLDLSAFTKDPDDPLATLDLTASGNVQLIPAINGLLVTMLTPGATFTGSESITFTVKDPAGASSSRVVKFTVRDVNTPPRWLNSKNYNFNEDDTLQIPLEDLRARVADNEDPKENFVFFLVNNQNVKAFTSETHFGFYATPNWNGSETVGLVVS
ncbi:MAG: PKD domain-containing protein, partial [candidate division KSB1 bacterium]